MTTLKFSTGDVSAADAFDCWQEIAGSRVLGLALWRGWRWSGNSSPETNSRLSAASVAGALGTSAMNRWQPKNNSAFCPQICANCPVWLR
ncbi:MAG TPA: hypothetical protein VGO70_00025 [Arsenicitalea sp.]|jgi:hypothetical protein|nr:hypothetical protein [Arsenicitalea sp.]